MEFHKLKIEKVEKKAKVETDVLLGDIPIGTVFRYGYHAEGPYLRVKDGFINLMYMRATSEDKFYSIPNFISIPATLQIEEA